MATKPNKVQKLGNIPAVRNTFYFGEKPELSVASDQRAAFLRFKTDKETNTVRESMAVFVNLLTPSSIIHGDAKGTEFLQSLVNEAQDSVLKRVADGSCEFDVAQDYSKLIADYFDNSRTASGNRVSAEVVGNYFDAELSSWLMDRIVAKFPQFSAEKIAAVVSQYRASFCDLAKYQMPHSKPVTEMLARAWNESPVEKDESELAEWISGRIKKLQDRHNEAEMLVDAI